MGVLAVSLRTTVAHPVGTGTGTTRYLRPGRDVESVVYGGLNGGAAGLKTSVAASEPT